MAKATRQRTKSATRRKKAPPKKKRPLKKPQGRTEITPGNALTYVIYGPSGVGKTSLAANFPNPHFIYDEHEEGIVDLCNYGQCPEPTTATSVSDWSELLNALVGMMDESEPMTIILDSLTGIEQYCFQHCCQEDYDGDWSARGFYSYQQGPNTAATRYWGPEFIHALNDLNRAGHTIVLLAHSELKKFEDPTSVGYERYQPFLHKQLWKVTNPWAKLIVFYNYWSAIVQPDGSLKKKPDLDSEARNLYTTHSAAFDAKNRCGLPPIIDAGQSGEDAYSNLMAAFTS